MSMISVELVGWIPQSLVRFKLPVAQEMLNGSISSFASRSSYQPYIY